jgi:hypothetical protein
MRGNDRVASQIRNLPCILKWWTYKWNYVETMLYKLVQFLLLTVIGTLSNSGSGQVQPNFKPLIFTCANIDEACI